ncbi:RecA-family ATPase [Rhodococcus ruber]|uniref:AAA family ATPase n=1 Tax=Rhodococcus ruber TaxID=1830 RepID=UPI001AE99251|nr:AAA family ATPase [Rhodococcus ruber]MBP2211106.1 RecA-family ATPase [Rhodococcus ruber]
MSNANHTPGAKLDWAKLAAMAADFTADERTAMSDLAAGLTAEDLEVASEYDVALAEYEAVGRAIEAEGLAQVVRELAPATARVLDRLRAAGAEPTTVGDNADVWTVERCPVCTTGSLDIHHLGDPANGRVELNCDVCQYERGVNPAKALGIGPDDLDDVPFVAPVEEPSADELSQTERRFQRKVEEELDRLRAREEAKRRFAEANRPERKSLRSKLLSFDDLADIKPPTPLIDHFLFQDTLVQLAAVAGSFKSFMVISQACSVATGLPWLGHQVTERRKVVYVAAEGVSGVRARVQAWCDENGVDSAELRGWLYILPCPVQLKDPADVEDAVELVKELDAGLFVIDTRARCTVGYEENSATEQSIAISMAEKIKEGIDCTLYFVHHGGKGQAGPRGSTAWDGQVWSDLRSVGKKDTLVAELSCHKHKDAVDGCTHGVQLKQVTIPEEKLPGWTETQRTTLVVTGETFLVGDTASKAADAEEAKARKDEEKALVAAVKERQREAKALAQLHDNMAEVSQILAAAAPTELSESMVLGGIRERRLADKTLPPFGHQKMSKALEALRAGGHVSYRKGPNNAHLYTYVTDFEAPSVEEPDTGSWAAMAMADIESDTD